MEDMGTLIVHNYQDIKETKLIIFADNNLTNFC